MRSVRNPFRRTVVMARPKPCSMAEAQHALDRLVAAGIDAEIVEHADNGLNMFANTKVGGEVTPDERHVISRPSAAGGDRRADLTSPARHSCDRSCGQSCLSQA